MNSLDVYFEGENMYYRRRIARLFIQSSWALGRELNSYATLITGNLPGAALRVS